MTPQILYEDNHVLVAIKPPNVPSQADSSQDADMLTLLKAYIAHKYHKPGAVYLGLVHRLDRPASGLMVFARTSKAAGRLSQQMRDGTFEKRYRLLCESVPVAQSGIWEDTLVKLPGNFVRVVPSGTPGGKAAALRYRTLQVYPGGQALCEVELLTGRAHQIRVQFASRGHALVGDARYGCGGRQLALWSYQLVFDHPTQKTRLRFAQDAPSSLLLP